MPRGIYIRTKHWKWSDESKQKSHKPLKKFKNKICEVCGKEYYSKTDKQKFCSNKCRWESRRGRKRKPFPKEWKDKMSKSKKGKTGEKSNAWKGGISPLNDIIRHCFKYIEWVKSIFNRDNFTCQICGQYSGNLEVHHVKRFHYIIEENHITSLDQALICSELWNVYNGITLCKECHKDVHKKEGN